MAEERHRCQTTTDNEIGEIPPFFILLPLPHFPAIHSLDARRWQRGKPNSAELCTHIDIRKCNAQ